LSVFLPFYIRGQKNAGEKKEGRNKNRVEIERAFFSDILQKLTDSRNQKRPPRTDN
jgi:hypothetical protein